MRLRSILIILSFFWIGCNSSQIKTSETKNNFFFNDGKGCIDTTSPSMQFTHCDETGCSGTYTGPEFTDGSDVAHQFSNTMSKQVGDKLKELYSEGSFSKVDLPNIRMTTNGMGSGNVEYHLDIPFKTVTSKCEAFTSFDHVGGWNHKPALASRKKQLQKALLSGDTLNISDLKTTPEGLQEYWIQWKNNITQADCEDK